LRVWPNNCTEHQGLNQHVDYKSDSITVLGFRKTYTLIDFGISMKYLDEEGNHITRTKLPNFKGTLEFIATE
jgi:hypothetical protein